jgi:hypothetical protein
MELSTDSVRETYSLTVRNLSPTCLPYQEPGDISQYSDWVKGWKTKVRSPAGARDSSLLHIVQTDFGANPVSYAMGTGAPITGGTRQRCEVDLSLAYSAENKNGGDIPPLPIFSHDVVFNDVLKYRDNFYQFALSFSHIKPKFKVYNISMNILPVLSCICAIRTLILGRKQETEGTLGKNIQNSIWIQRDLTN